ncbi:MAG: Cna B-type domain-containing protein [Flexilinea sp.]|nr:Cna B-type domain-containing protein [Flexilinea sp.]
MKKNAVLMIIVLLLSVLLVSMIYAESDTQYGRQLSSGVEQQYFNEPVTVTFMLDNEVHEKALLEKGNSIGDSFFSRLHLPEKDGFTALGWQISEGVYLAANTIINQDMTVNAAYEKITTTAPEGNYTSLDGRSGFITVKNQDPTKGEIIMTTPRDNGERINATFADHQYRTSYGDTTPLVTWQFIYASAKNEDDTQNGAYYYLRNSLGQYLNLDEATKHATATFEPKELFVGLVSDNGGSGEFFVIRPNGHTNAALYAQGNRADLGFSYGENQKYDSPKVQMYFYENDNLTAEPGFTVHFDVLGGSEPAPLSVFYNGESGLRFKDQIVVFPDYSGTLYDNQFLGWSTTPYASSPEKYANDKENFKSATGTKTYYAVYENLTTIIFNANGGSFTPNPLKQWAGASIELPATAGLKIGYKFTGWSKTPDGTDPITEPCTVEISADGVCTLYAVWDPIDQVTVKLDPNGGSAESAYEIKAYPGETINLSTYAVSRENKKLVGWAFTADAETPDIRRGEGYRVTEAEETTLYAIWSDQAEVTFLNPDGTAAYDKRTVNCGESITIPAGPENLSGFKGWSENRDSQLSYYRAGESYTVTDDVTLYAICAQPHTLRFVARYSSGTVPAAQTGYPGQTVTIPDYTGTNNGKIFVGWGDHTDNSNMIAYRPGDTFIFPEQDVELWTLWAGAGVDILFMDGSKDINKMTGKIRGDTITLPPYPNAPEGFSGWSDGGAQSYQVGTLYTIPVSLKSDIRRLELKAEYSSVPVQVTFNMNVNGISLKAPDPETSIDGSWVTLPEPVDSTYVKDGKTYQFIGWTDVSNYKAKVNENFYHPVYKAHTGYNPNYNNVTLYALWSETENGDGRGLRFQIRLDGIIPDEPAGFPINQYTNSVVYLPANISDSALNEQENGNKGNAVLYKNGDNQVMKEYRWVVSTEIDQSNLIDGYYQQNAVTENLNWVPSVDDIRAMVPSFDPETQFVLWYVLKYQGYQGDWRIDGIVLNKSTKVPVVYHQNLVNHTVQNMPGGYEVESGTNITVGAHAGATGLVREPYTTGYEFKGWCVGSTSCTEPLQTAEIYRVTQATHLYAQWRSLRIPTTSRTIEKKWEDSNNPDRPHSITVKLMNGETVAGTVTLPNAAGSWTGSVLNLDVNDAEGNPIVYSWDEVKVPNYSSEMKQDEENPLKTILTNTLTFVPDPKLEIVKKVNGKDEITVDKPETVTYTVTVSNTGNVDITGITLSDDFYTADAQTPFDLKAMDADGNVDSKEITYTYTLDQAAIDNGEDIVNTAKVNTAKAVGTYEEKSVESNTDTATVKIDQNQDLDLTKTVISRKENYVLGDRVEYQITVKNTGNVTLHNISLSDPMLDENQNTRIPQLAPGDTATLTGYHTVTVADVVETKVINKVTAKADETDEKSDEVTVTTAKIPLEITADSGTHTYDGTEFTLPTWKITKGTLVDPESAMTVTVTGSATRWTGTKVTNEAVKDSAKIIDSTGTDVTAAYDITYKNGELEILKRAITIKAESDTKTYDGTALTKDSLDKSYESQLASTDSISAFTVTGSQTTAGHSDNKPSGFQISHQTLGDVTDCYDITPENGTLTVEPRPLTITAGSDTKVYDGTPLTKDSIELSETTPLAEGDSIQSRTVNGSQTEVGSSANVPSNAVIVNKDGETVTSSYIIKYENGELTVTRNRSVIITAASDTKVYDGTPLTNDGYTYSGLAAGDYIDSVTVTGTQTNTGTSENVPSAVVIRNAAGEDVTGNYENITYRPGTLTVTQKPLFITADSDVKIYDSTSLKRETYTNTALAAGDELSEVVVTGSRIQVGISPNTPSNGVIRNGAGEDVTGNYKISYISGTLEVKPRPVTVTADSFTKEFGQLDPIFTAQVAGTLNGDTVDYTLTREAGEDAGVYPITATGAERQGNYIVSYYPGTLTIVYNPAAYTVSKVWNDDGNRDGIRPVSLSVSLVGSDGSVRTRRLTEANGWTATITDLPLYAGGIRIEYSWNEETVDGYTGTSAVTGNVTTFTNTHEIARTSASVNKIWDDRENAGGSRPSSLGVVLRSNGTTILGVSLNEGNNWSATADNLPLNENGSPVSYVWYEQTLRGGYYAVSSTTAGNTTTLVNSNLHTLVIHYRYADGSEAFTDYTDRLGAGETFVVDSPELTGYTASQVSVVGIMPSRDVEITVIYTPEGQPVVTPTPLPARTPEPGETEETPQKEVPQPRVLEPDETHPLVVPTPNILVDINDLRTALGLGNVVIANYGYALE